MYWLIGVCSIYFLLLLQQTSSQVNCKSLGGSYNCTIPLTYLNDSWCDCPTCVDESSWTCSSCAASGCTDDPDSCVGVQCQSWGISTTTHTLQDTTTTNSPLDTTDTTATSTTDAARTSSTANSNSESNVPDPPEDLCIVSKMFDEGVLNTYPGNMIFQLMYSSSQINNGPIIYHNYHWEDFYETCWEMYIINNTWSLIEYCRNGHYINETIGVYCVSNGGDYVPTDKDPGNPSDCIEWSIDDFKVSDKTEDCSLFDTELFYMDYVVIGYAGICFILLFMFVCKCGKWNIYCRNETYDGLLLETYSKILQLHG